MAVYRKKGRKVYTMDFIFQGTRIVETTRMRTIQQARTVERNRHQELEEGRAGIKKAVGPQLFRVTAATWHEMKAVSWSPSMARIELTNLGHLASSFDKLLVIDITPEGIAAYQRRRLNEKASPKTINLEVGTLRAVMIYAGQWSRLQGKVKLLKVRDDHGHALTLEEEQKLLDECSNSRSRQIVVMVILALYTGARFGVVRKLKWKQIDFATRSLRWGQDKTESGDHRTIPLARKPLESLRLWAENFPNRKPNHFVFPTERIGQGGASYDFDPLVAIGSIKTAWIGVQARSGVHCRVHDLRHTATSRMLKAGIPIHQIGDIQGWSASQLVLMIRKYSHFNTNQHRAAVDSIDLEVSHPFPHPQAPIDSDRIM